MGETFTVLTASSVTGTFSDSTIAINTSFHFNVTYTATGVVLTVASGPVAPSSPIAPAAQIAAAKPATGTSKSPVLTSGLRQRVIGTSRVAKPILVAGFGESSARSNLILARTPEFNNLRSWEHVPVAPTIARPSAVNSPSLHNNVATPKVGVAESHTIGAPSTLAGWMHNSTNQRVPVKIMLPSLPRMTR